MSAKLVYHDGELLSYPVGECIGANLSTIDKMVSKFINTRYFQKKSVNVICRGSSGAILASFFAKAIHDSKKHEQVKIVHIKKEGENSHSSDVPSLLSTNAVNVIVDDFCASGNTLNSIYAALTKRNRGEVVIHGLCLSGHDSKDNILNKLSFTPEYFFLKCK